MKRIIAILMTLAVSSMFAVVVPVGTAHASSCFVGYDNTFYTGENLARDIGIQRSNIVYATAEWKTLFAAGQLPPKAEFQDRVLRNSVHSGPVVLNFETIFLSGTDVAVVEQRAALWMTMLDWIEEVIPTKPLGAYHFAEQTRQAYPHMTLARQISARFDFFASSDYTKDNDITAWNTQLTDSINRSAYIEPNKPVYSYIWAQYHPNTDGTFVDPSMWRQQLEILKQRVDAFVIWSSTSWPIIDDRRWIDETKAFVAALPPCV